MLPDNYAQAALYPLGGDDFIVGLAGGYDTLMPGETRVIRYAFVIYRNSFAEQDGIDNADLSAMEVAYLDCSPWRVIALKLANARDAAKCTRATPTPTGSSGARLARRLVDVLVPRVSS